jgi:superkiller protein 3
VKALNHALELNPDDWICSYFIAEVKQQMGLFEDALHILGNICQARPDEAGPLWLVGQTHLDLGLFQLGDSFQIRAEESFLSAIEFALEIIRRMPGFRTMAWKMIGDATSYLSSFSAFIAEDAVRLKLRSIRYLPSPDWAEKVVEIVGLPSFADGAPPSPLTVGIVAIHSYLSQISLSSPNHPSNQASWYDLAVALQSWVLNAPPTTSSENVTFIKEKVVEYFKKALQEDPGNDMYWVGLGNACFSTHARAAQHAYIKALEIDGKNAATWVNLGLLYFHHGDIELANSALHRAQVLDPDNTVAWVGQFLVASVNKDKADATLLLEHAVTLSKPVVCPFPL